MTDLSLNVELRKGSDFEICSECSKYNNCAVAGLFVIKCVVFEKNVVDVEKAWSNIRNEEG